MPDRVFSHPSWPYILKAAALAACLTGFVSCTSSGSHLSASLDHTGLDGDDSSPIEREDRRTALPANRETSNLFHEMIQQGNYSDAAILKNLQDFKPRPTSLAPMFETLPDPSKQIAIPDLSYSPSTTNTTLGAGWHTKVGWTFILDGNYPAAEAAYRLAIRHETGSAEAYLGLGMALMFQGRREQAITAYEEAIKIQPGYAAALVHLGYAYADDGNEDQVESRKKARTLFQQASDLGDPFAMLALMGFKEMEEGK